MIVLTYRTLYFLQVWEKQGSDFVRHWKILPRLSPEIRTANETVNDISHVTRITP